MALTLIKTELSKPHRLFVVAVDFFVINGNRKVMKNKRYKKIMQDMGMPESHSLLAALKQVANEVAQEHEALSKEKIDVVTNCLISIANNTNYLPSNMHEKAEEALFFIRHGTTLDKAVSEKQPKKTRSQAVDDAHQRMVNSNGYGY